MSVQFGNWSQDGSSYDVGEDKKMLSVFAAYSPDGLTVTQAGLVTLIFGACHTTRESKREQQPAVTSNGMWVLWDGRLDNREDCTASLHLPTNDLTDLEIVCAAWDKWETDCFSRLIGDWALSVWNPRGQSLILAKDFLGTHHLYYSIESRRVTWSTILEPLLLVRGARPKICEKYVASWLSAHPKASLTPYEGIFSVPPSSAVTIYPHRTHISSYWDFDLAPKASRGTAEEHADRLLVEFQKSVRRRMRSDRLVVDCLRCG